MEKKKFRARAPWRSENYFPFMNGTKTYMGFSPLDQLPCWKTIQPFKFKYGEQIHSHLFPVLSSKMNEVSEL